MFCESCGHELGKDEKICTECGHSSMDTPPVDVSKKNSKYIKVLFILVGVIVFMLIIGWFSSIEFDSNYEDEYSVDDDYESSIFTELNYNIEPVGYFDDMSLFYSETLTSDEWYGHIAYYETENQESLEIDNDLSENEKVFSSVVKVVCIDDEDYFIYGSGTNIDPAGYVLTNYHVIEGVNEDDCVVGFPDPATGLIMEAYSFDIITDQDNETGHDLAYLAINDPAFDEGGNVYGYREKIDKSIFPFFEQDEQCSNTPLVLGDKILILGYPPLSGGALTITDGLISSLYSPDNYIITSAKIIGGNSGGLSIDESGCHVGVPTAVYYEEQEEYLGEIIDSEFVDEFNAAIQDDLEEYYELHGI